LRVADGTDSIIERNNRDREIDQICLSTVSVAAERMVSRNHCKLLRRNSNKLPL
jgi:hypothetical protein